jgi:hypothetical protein
VSFKPREGSKQRGRERCKARTKAGKPCQAPEVEAGLCFFHAHPEKLAEFGRQGGQKNRHWKIETEVLPYRSVKSIDEVCELLEETINRVRQGPFDLRAANTIGMLAGTYMKALSERTESPEPTDSGASGGMYTSLFERLQIKWSTDVNDGACPLYPDTEDGAFVLREPIGTIPLATPMPAMGESIDKPPMPSHDQPGVITVEVG